MHHAMTHMHKFSMTLSASQLKHSMHIETANMHNVKMSMQKLEMTNVTRSTVIPWTWK